MASILQPDKINSVWWILVAHQQKDYKMKDFLLLVPVKMEISILDFRNIYGTRMLDIICLGGRHPEKGKDPVLHKATPILRRSSLLADCLVVYHHGLHHHNIRRTSLYVRNDAWVTEIRKLCLKVDKECLYCKKPRAVRCSQVMGSLPLSCITP